MKTQISISSMRAALNSTYCMRAALEARKKQVTSGYLYDAEAFHYQEGQHAVNGNGGSKDGQEKKTLPPEIKVTQTPEGKHWFTPTIEVELRGDVLEIRDGLGKIIDAVILNKVSSKTSRSSLRKIIS